jgi:ADP-heptose:LPS heptosyltransferase
MRWRPAAISGASTDPHRRESIRGCLAAVAAGDIQVGPISGPVHVAAVAGKPSVVIYGGYEHPDCSSYPGNINLYTALPCSPCWLLMEPCPYDRVCLSRISPERGRGGDRLPGPG